MTSAFFYSFSSTGQTFHADHFVLGPTFPRGRTSRHVCSRFSRSTTFDDVLRLTVRTCRLGAGSSALNTDQRHGRRTPNVSPGRWQCRRALIKRAGDVDHHDVISTFAAKIAPVGRPTWLGPYPSLSSVSVANLLLFKTCTPRFEV